MKKAVFAVVMAAKARLKGEHGGISPIVVTLGLAILLVGILIAVSPSIQTAVTNAITSLTNRIGQL